MFTMNGAGLSLFWVVIRLSRQKQVKKDVEVLDLRPKPRPKPPKLRLWALLGLTLLITGTTVGMLKTGHEIPPITNHNDGSGPSRIVISNATNPGGTGTGTSPPGATVTLVHGKA